MNPQELQRILATAHERLRLGNRAGALQCFETVLGQTPTLPDVWFNYARCLQDEERFADSVAAYDRVAALQPGSADIWDNRGAALHDMDRPAEALASFDRALALRPAYAQTYSNRGLSLFALKRANEAIAAFDKALALSQNETQRASLRYNRAMASLATHDLRSGWAGFDARWDAGMVRSARHEGLEPRWRGEKLAGALRIWPEQGIGDEILFSRLAPLTLTRAERVVLQCAPRLVPLFARSFPDLEVRGVDAPAPTVAAQIATGSLGAALGIGVEDLGGGRSYLVADPDLRAHLRARYERLARGRPVIGIAWTSRAARLGASKSAALADWGALLRRDALFVNLQYGDVGVEIAEARAQFQCEIVEDADIDQMTDLDAFAAQVAAMDRVISVSNTSVHVAGALGVPCDVLVAPARGRLWYWGLDGETTPWYASVRLVRRTLDESWAEQIARVAAV